MLRQRIRLLQWTLSTALVSTLILCPRLWVTERPFPAVAVWGSLPDLPHALSIAFSSLLAIGVIVVPFLGKPGVLYASLPALAAILVAFDVNRLQPWFYQYVLMFAAMATVDWKDLESRRSKSALAACAVILASLYVWSGVQKANLSFATHVFPWLLQPLGDGAVESLKRVWFVAPVAETLIGLSLLSSRTRHWGVALAVATHSCILLALGPFGHGVNPVVWPWNVWMPILVVILFYRTDQPILPAVWSTTLGKGIVILVGVLPALNFVGLWDGAVSGSLYSGRQRDGWIYLTERGVARLPRTYAEGNKAITEESPGRFRLDISAWAEWALSVPPYAEPRMYRGIMKRLEHLGVPRNEMTLLVRDRPCVVSDRRAYSADTAW